VNGVTFDVRQGESLGIVGESGCGKSTLTKSILRLLPQPPSRIPRGEIFYGGRDILKMTSDELRKLRGKEISMIFQDPMTALNPTMKIGKQIVEMVRCHSELSPSQAEARAVEMLETVGIDKSRFNEYPYQFSGGMQQRVGIAIALASDPALILADEPTTALDVTIQAQVLEMIKHLIEIRGATLLMITHNLAVVAETCDYVAVLYGGEVMEYGSKREVFKSPAHPYTIGLFGALPDLSKKAEKLTPIAGIMPEPSDLPSGCKFHTRCPYATEACSAGPVQVHKLGGTHICQCHNISAVRTGNRGENT
jgi:peptide/nickel transport system ATP-binding protein